MRLRLSAGNDDAYLEHMVQCGGVPPDRIVCYRALRPIDCPQIGSGCPHAFDWEARPQNWRCRNQSFTMTGGKWILEVYVDRATDEAPLMTLEFENLPQLRLALTNIRDHRLVVQMPAGAMAEDRTTLLDLRAQGFNILMRGVN